MTCLRHPAAASHRGHCPACLLEDALDEAPDAVSSPAQQYEPANLTIQLPLGHTTSSSVFLVRLHSAPFRLLRLKTWHAVAPRDFMTRFQQMQRHLSEWNEDMVRTPLAAWVDVSRRAWVLGEFNQGLPIVDRLTSGGVDPGDARACLERVREIVRAAHRRGLVHGSLGSGNIIVTAHCARAYLLDFGHGALLADDSDDPPAPSVDISALDRLTADVRERTTRSLCR
jgi:hypothetical protein